MSKTQQSGNKQRELVSGVIYVADGGPFPSATVTIELIDCALQDVPALVIASTVLRNVSRPDDNMLTFSLMGLLPTDEFYAELPEGSPYRGSRTGLADYALQARVDVDGREELYLGHFINQMRHNVDLTGRLPAQVTVIVKQIPPTPLPMRNSWITHEERARQEERERQQQQADQGDTQNDS